MKRTKFALSALLIALSTALRALSGCASQPAAPAAARSGPSQGAAAAIAVRTAPPSLQTLELNTDFIGTVQAAETVNVYPKMAGTVSAVHVSAGQAVKAGDLLFELDAAMRCWRWKKQRSPTILRCTASRSAPRAAHPT